MAYALELTEAERARYRFMAESARTEERDQWAAAGIVPGARVADIGCGPGAVLRLLAEEVGERGWVDGVDADAVAVGAAVQEVAGLPQVAVRVGDATATGLDPGSYDVVMCRHVLAHNGGWEAAIVAHLAELTRPGGAVCLVDVDATAIRLYPEDPDLGTCVPAAAAAASAVVGRPGRAPGRGARHRSGRDAVGGRFRAPRRAPEPALVGRGALRGRGS